MHAGLLPSCLQNKIKSGAQEKMRGKTQGKENQKSWLGGVDPFKPERGDRLLGEGEGRQEEGAELPAWSQLAKRGCKDSRDTRISPSRFSISKKAGAPSATPNSCSEKRVVIGGNFGS